MRRIAPLFLAVSAISGVTLAGCHNDDANHNRHTRSRDKSDVYYDRSQTAGERIYHDQGAGDVSAGDASRIGGRSSNDPMTRTPATTPPVDNATHAGIAGAADPATAPPRQPDASGTRGAADAENPAAGTASQGDATKAE